jgi:hypothetical protein
MFLVGNVNVENLVFDSVGVTDPLSISFTLPRKSVKRRKLKVKYFGYHAGLSEDNPDHVERRYFVEVGDVKRKYYSWRLPIGEIQMEVFSHGDSITHENVGVHHYSNDGSSKNTNLLRYATTKACEAQSVDGVGVVLKNNATRPMPLLRGHSEVCDVSVGFVETNADQVDVRLTLIPDEIDPVDVATDSFEKNIRMDSISFVLELV